MPLAEAAPALARFTGAGRRFEPHGRTASGALVYDDYAHHPTEVRATLDAARTLEPRRLVACFQPHLYSRTRMLAREFGRALALADVVVVLDVYRARERAEDFPGVSGCLVAAGRRRRRRRAPGLVAARASTTPSACCAASSREGDLLLTLGAGRRGRAGAEARRVSAPAGVEADYPLARLTTVRTGGPADYFARPDSRRGLAELLAWADARGDRGRSGRLRIEPAGSG